MSTGGRLTWRHKTLLEDDFRMIPAQTLGALNNLHAMMNHLIEDLPAADLHQRFHPDIPSLGWQFGRAIYLETYLIDERLLNDADLSDRVRHLFAHDIRPTPALEAQLPPKEHLLNWAMEIQERHITLLANPEQLLPSHPWLNNGWLPEYLLQLQARAYEGMLGAVSAHALAQPLAGYQVQHPLRPQAPRDAITEIPQGHYRIGARDGVAFDNELPAQVVELSNYRIAECPVSNSEYLAFMLDQGYQNDNNWDTAGTVWRDQFKAEAPWHWRRDGAGNWYAVGINGPFELIADEPVMGLCQHEASAYARWVAHQPGFEGAVLQHEYQWEVATRTNSVKEHGRAREWCSNTFEAYDEYEIPKDPELATRFEPGLVSLRGGSLHTQPQLRRASMRYAAMPGERQLFAGLRLVLPPSKAT